MKCTELVMKDHVVLRRGLDILDGMIRKLESGERIEIADVSAILKFFKIFGEEYHQATEEGSLFPVLMRAAAPGGLIHQMVADHGEERSLVAWMTDAMASRRIVDFAFTSRRLIVILRNHFDREDAVLGQMAGELLSEEADAMIAEEFVRAYKDPASLANFQRLERKYLPKSEKVVVDPRPEPAKARPEITSAP